MDEMIYVVPTEKVMKLIDSFQTKDYIFEEDSRNLLFDTILAYRTLARRGDVEENPSFLQVIPYATIYTKENGEYLFLAYKRSSKGNEKRLRNEKSIGFGGHMNDRDNCAITCLERELKEELSIDLMPHNLEFSGVIYTPYVDVSKVHVGLHYMYYIHPEKDVSISEEIESIELLNYKELLEIRSNLELWSKTIAYQMPNILDSSVLTTI
ncbi:MAG TPA: NUDIX domain-containing protein [Mesotoga sp.]|nr:NUDIX domain-containing protein [Mesotoga sp.]